MGMQAYEDFKAEKHARIPLWKEWIVKLFGKRWGYDNCCLAYVWRGKMYIIK
jgi:hypothetical protein